MIAAALLCSFFAAPLLEVTIAPDQPAPYVYTGEPIILQIKSNEDGKATGHATITGDDGKSVAVALPEFPLRANGAHWQPLNDAPAAKGRFNVHVTLDTGDAKVEADLVYCRIDRPADGVRAPLRVRVDTPDPVLLHGLRGIPAKEITVPAGLSELQTFVASATKSGFRITILLDAATAADTADLAKLASALGEGVAAWRVPVPEISVEAIDAIAGALRDAGSKGSVEVFLARGPEKLEDYLAAGLGRNTHKIFVPNSGRTQTNLASMRAAFEAVGYEGIRLQSIIGPQPGEGNDPDRGRVARDVLAAQYAGGASPELDAAALYSDGAFDESYPSISAMAHRLNGYDYFAELPASPRVHGVVFRHDGAWLVALWANGQPAVHMLPVGNATGIMLTDANNNALPPPENQDGSLRMTLTTAPAYINGEGGPLLANVARAAARREADSFVKNKSFQKDLPPEIIELMKPIAAPNFNRVDRVSFFALLRVFPLLEQRWHDGTTPRGTAAPAMASIERLLRYLCVIEQDSGEPFIELLQETVARCGDYQSQYLTSTGGASEKHERADWLLSEVARLTAEAKSLADADRGIEAVGVASIAEWRARSLEFAINAAPLGVPEPPRAEPEPAAAKPTPSAKTPKPAPKKTPAPKKGG